MGVKVTIGGVDYTNAFYNGAPASAVDLKSIVIDDDITASNKQASFDLYLLQNIPSVLPRPKGGQECIIYGGQGEREFAGVIVGPEEENPSADTMFYHVVCKDYEYWFNRRTVINTYNGRTLESIITASDGIVSTVNQSGAGFTTNHVYPSGVIMSGIKRFDHRPPTDAIQELADYVGFFFFIDYYKDVHFTPIMSDPSPVAGNILYPDTAGGCQYYHDLKITEDVSSLRNQVYFYGHKLPQAHQITQTFTGDGNTVSVDLLYEPKHSLKSADTVVKVNGVTQLLKLDVTDGTASSSGGTFANVAYVYYTHSTIRWDIAPAAGATITVTYYPLLPVQNMYNNPAAFKVMKQRDKLDGIYEYSINDPKLTSTDASVVNLRGQYELLKYAYPHYSATFTSFVQGWSIGQFFYINSKNRMNGEFKNKIFYVIKVHKTLFYADSGSQNFQYDITISDIPFNY